MGDPFPATSPGPPARLAPQLAMVRIGLNRLPAVAPPAGYALRHYRPGDEQAWEQIIDSSFGSDSRTFEGVIASKPAFQPQRVWFIETRGDLVATATAWRDERFGEQTGYVHMVGVVPRHQGKKLGYWVSLAVLHQLASEGIGHALLQTDDDRLAAIITYRRLGFVPLLIHENQASRWEAVFGKLAKRPA